MDEAATIIVSALVGGIVGGGAITKLGLAALETRLRTVFYTSADAAKLERDIREDLDGIGRKVERNAGLFVALDDRTGDLEEKVSVLEERQTQQWGRISEQMESTARTLRDVMKEVKAVADTQHQLALRMERLRNHSGGD